MKNKILCVIIFCTVCQFSYSQKDSFGDLYQECIFKPLSDKQVIDIKKHTKKFEDHLIEKGVLKDKSDRSYLELYIVLDENASTYQKEYNYAFIDSIAKITKPFPLIHNIDCFNELKQKSDFKKSKFYVENFEDKEENSILKKLSEDDFASHYFRFRTLYILESTNYFNKIINKNN